MSRYAFIDGNDIVNGEGVCVSFWVQGCPHHCEGCFNPETWDFHEGEPYTDHTKWEIIELISKNGIRRNFSVLGGEPMAIQNLPMTAEVVHAIRNAYPDIKIYLWTGYTLNQLNEMRDPDIKIYLWTGYTLNQLNEMRDPDVAQILDDIDVLIDGPFREDLKDLSLKLRGSSNQLVRRKGLFGWKIDG